VREVALDVCLDEILAHLGLMLSRHEDGIEAILADLGVITEYRHPGRAGGYAASKAAALRVRLLKESSAEVRRLEYGSSPRERREAAIGHVQLGAALRGDDVPRAVDAGDVSAQPEIELTGPGLAEDRPLVARNAPVGKIQAVIEAPGRIRIGPRVEQLRE